MQYLVVPNDALHEVRTYERRCVHMHAKYIHIRTYVYAISSENTPHKCMYVHMHVCIGITLHTSTQVCKYVNTYVHTYDYT